MENKEKNTKNELNNESKDIQKPASVGKRIIAIVLLVIMAVLFGIFIYCIIFNQKYVIPMLFVVIIFPILVYLFIWVRKVFNKSED